MPTVLPGLRSLDAPPLAAALVQAAVAVAVALGCWRAISQRPDARSIAMSLAGTLLVTPYAMLYDMPILAAAVLLHVKSRLDCGDRLGLAETALFAAIFLCLFGMLRGSLPLLAPALLLAVFCRIAMPGYAGKCRAI